MFEKDQQSILSLNHAIIITYQCSHKSYAAYIHGYTVVWIEKRKYYIFSCLCTYAVYACDDMSE